MNPNQQAKLLEMLDVQADVGYEKPFVVPTPRPYVVDLRHFGPSEKEQGLAKAALLDRVDALYKLLHLLNIDLRTAYKKEYTLNRTTHDDLHSKVAYGDIDGEALRDARQLLNLLY